MAVELDFLGTFKFHQGCRIHPHFFGSTHLFFHFFFFFDLIFRTDLFQPSCQAMQHFSRAGQHQGWFFTTPEIFHHTVNKIPVTVDSSPSIFSKCFGLPYFVGQQLISSVFSMDQGFVVVGHPFFGGP